MTHAAHGTHESPATRLSRLMPPPPERQDREAIAPVAHRLLVVDDDPDIVRFLEVNFRSAGYEVHLAYDGEEGLEKIRALMPDLVILDVMMPRIDGWEVARRVRADPALDDVAIIMITAKALPTDKVLSLTAGADDHIIKPFDPIEVFARVRGTLRRYAEGKTERPFYGRGDVSAEEVASYLMGRAIVDNLTAGRYVSLSSRWPQVRGTDRRVGEPDDPESRANYVRWQHDNALRLEGVPLEEADREMRVAGKGEAALARLLRRRLNGTEGS